uniref:Uncharacterized protein n=1 Tax=Plectus sambesii TaxID=2011161 RepID=A0A914WR23_9BILA
MHLSATSFLLFIAFVTFSCATPVVRYHRIDRFLRAHDESLFGDDDEDITGVQPSPEIPRDPTISELDIDEEIDFDDDSKVLRRRRRVIGVAPPAVLPPVENEEDSSEEDKGSERRRRELREHENEDGKKEVAAGTPPPFLPSPADDQLGPLWVRLRRQTVPTDNSESSESKEDDSDDGAQGFPRPIQQQRKRFRKSLNRRITRCADGSCSEESSESRSNEMTSVQPEDRTERPPVRLQRDLDSGTEEDMTVDDSDKQIDADQEAALRLPRRAKKQLLLSMPVAQEEGGAVIDPGLGTMNSRESEEEDAGLLRRHRRHHYRHFHHRHREPLQQQKRNARELHKFASPHKTGKSAATGANGW